MTTTADIAESLVKLEDVLARPVESFPPHPMGTPLRHPSLAHYGPVTKWNARAGLWLLSRYFYAELRAFERELAELPVEVRRRIEIQIVLIKFERALAEAERALEAFERATEVAEV